MTADSLPVPGASGYAHTPYDGSRKPFSIGLAPLDPSGWIEFDHDHRADLAEKDRLLAESRDVVCRAEADTLGAQREARDLVAAHLLDRHADRFVAAQGGGIALRDGGRTVRFGSDLPLFEAARLIQDDLVLMRRGPDGWRIAAAVLCFPSSWSLAEKFGRSLDGIHEHVPGYAGSMAQRMARIFDNLKAEMPVFRLNWSIYPDAERHHPEAKQLPRAWFLPDGTIDPARVFVRVERQSLRRLPDSGDILFTIRILSDPLAALATHPDGAALATGLRTQLLGLDADQLAYKSLTRHRDALAALLARLAG